MKIEISIPPSVNSIWRVGRAGRVHCSKRYTDWRRTAGWELQTQRPARIMGPVIITIAAGRPDRRRRDVDGLPKAVLDLLQAHRVIENDSLVASLTSRWDSAVTPGRIVVEVERAPQQCGAAP